MRSQTVIRMSLGAFLPARRSELSPSDVDLPEGGDSVEFRLRREEVAQLAAISTARLRERARKSGAVRVPPGLTAQ